MLGHGDLHDLIFKQAFVCGAFGIVVAPQGHFVHLLAAYSKLLTTNSAVFP